MMTSSSQFLQTKKLKKKTTNVQDFSLVAYSSNYLEKGKICTLGQG